VDPITRLEIVEAVRTVKARYFRYIDTKAWDAFPELFVPDVEIDVTDDMVHVGRGAGAGLVHGRDRFAASVPRVLEGVTTVHHGHMPEIEVVDASHARGIWAMFDRLQFPDGRVQCGAGHYHEEYAFHDGQWRIARMKLTRLTFWDE
jgi:hypothetical protein